MRRTKRQAARGTFAFTVSRFRAVACRAVTLNGHERRGGHRWQGRECGRRTRGRSRFHCRTAHMAGLLLGLKGFIADGALRHGGFLHEWCQDVCKYKVSRVERQSRLTGAWFKCGDSQPENPSPSPDHRSGGAQAGARGQERSGRLLTQQNAAVAGFNDAVVGIQKSSTSWTAMAPSTFDDAASERFIISCVIVPCRT